MSDDGLVMAATSVEKRPVWKLFWMVVVAEISEVVLSSFEPVHSVNELSCE